jgi:hypothetical protein
MGQNLLKKSVLRIAMVSFYEERKKDIKESLTQAFCLGTPEKNISYNKYLYILCEKLFSNIFVVLN